MKMNKRLLVTSGMMLTAVAIALSTSTYAWFTMSNENTLSEFEIEARAASGGLEISLNGSDFDDEKVTMTSPNLKALDVTSPDGVQMFKASVVSDSTGKPTSYEYAKVNQDFYEFDLYFRTVNGGYICIDGSNCSIKPSTDAAYLDGTEALNKSNSGDFSRDYIAGAARFSFQVTGYQNEAKSYWNSANSGNVYSTPYIVTPDNEYTSGKKVSDIYLSKDELTGDWSVGTQSSHDSIYKPSSTTTKIANGTTISDTDYNDSTKISDQQKKLIKTDSNKVHTAIQDIYGIPQGLSTVEADKLTEKGWPSVSSYALAHIGNDGATNAPSGTENIGADTQSFTSGNNQITKVTCRVWIEGQDNEAQTPLAQGKFKVNLKFKFLPSTIVSNVKLATPTVTQTKVEKNNTTITWVQIAGASGYVIATRSGSEGSYTYTNIISDKGNEVATTNSTFYKELADGTYYIKALYADTSHTDLDSDWKEIVINTGA